MRKYWIGRFQNGDIVVYLEHSLIPPTLLTFYEDGKKPRVYIGDQAQKRMKAYEIIMRSSR